MDFKTALVKHIGSKIKDERLKIGLNQNDLGEKIGLTRTSISNIEAGRQQPTLDILYQICYNLGKEIHFFLPTYNDVSSLITTPENTTIDKLKTNRLSDSSINTVKDILNKYKL
ncbi:helix-turn-helix transcriptional regulator [Pedobacter sp. GSP4]|uniref:helix-turn-helix transcriptional regulator n=1 Tax=Pedobacter sp. GSP4 TaxID=3453716 RepID=UPI003EE9A58D